MHEIGAVKSGCGTFEAAPNVLAVQHL